MAATAVTRTAAEAYAADVIDLDRPVDISHIDQTVWDGYLPADPNIGTDDPDLRQAWSPNPFEREEAARSSSASAQVLRRSIQDADITVRVAAASNRNAPPDVLERAVADPDAHVRQAAVLNPSTPDRMVQRGLNDPDRAVYLSAWLTHQRRGL